MQLLWINGYFRPIRYQCTSSLASAQHLNQLHYHDNNVRGGLSWNMLSLKEAILFLEEKTSPSPSLEDLAGILYKCRKERSTTVALHLHAYMREHELDVNVSLGNYLLVLLVETGSMGHAQQVFDRLGHVDEHSWNFLISGYVNHGELKQALFLYEKLQKDGSTQCNAYTLVALLKACTKLKDMGQGLEIHANVARKGLLESDVFVGSTLIDMYGKCGSVVRAQEVFDKLSTLNIVSWTALMAGYAEHGSGEEALHVYERMQHAQFSPTAITFVCILKVCGTLGAIDNGREVHTDLVGKGFDRDIIIGSTLVHMYAKCGSLVTAQQVFDKLPIQDVALWNTLLGSYAQNGCAEKALNLYKKMQCESISSDAFTYVCIAKACVEEGFLQKGRQLHCDITRKGLEGDVFVGSTLVDMYAKHGALAEAQDVFDDLSFRAAVSWNSLIAGYAEHRCLDEALIHFKKMQQEGVLPDTITLVCMLKACGSTGAIDILNQTHTEIASRGLEVDSLINNTLVNSYAKCGLLDEAQELFHEHAAQADISWNGLLSGYVEHAQSEKALTCFKVMQHEGISRNVATLLCSLKACAILRDPNEGSELHGMIVKMGLSENDGFVGSALVDMYAKSGLVADAQLVFDRLAGHDVVTWTALIAGYVEQGACNEALKRFDQMQAEGISPVAATFLCSLKACACNEALDKGIELYTQIVAKGLEQDLVVGSTLVDMYAKVGFLVEARYVFDKLSSPDIVSWTALATGYVEHGCGEEALCCVKQMQQAGVFQGAFIFACGLKACAITASTLAGQEIHDESVKKGSEQELFVGSSLIDMYAKCGLLMEALEVFNKLPVRNAVSFNVLLAGHVAHGWGEEGLLLLDQMCHEGICPDVSTFICSLKTCGHIGAIHKGYNLHTDIAKRGFLERDSFVGSSLVDMYARFGCLVDAHAVFGKLPVRDAVTWIALIEGYVQHGADMEALKCFEQMQQEGVTPVAVTYICSLRSCCSIRAIDEARELHLGITKKGFDRDQSVGKMLVVTYARIACVDEAKRIFDKLQYQDDFCWSVLVKGYADSGRAKEALNCYEQKYFLA